VLAQSRPLRALVLVARQVFVMGCMAENLHARRRHQDLLLQLQTLVLALYADVRLNAEDHSFLDLALVMIGEEDGRILISKAAAVSDERYR